MDKKLLAFVILFVALIIAGYLYYPLEEGAPEEGAPKGVAPGRGLIGGGFASQEKMPPTTYPTTTLKSGEQYTSGPSFAEIAAGREISITVSITLEVDDVREKASNIMHLAYSLGGYVQHSSVRGDRGYLTIKVPRESLDSALSEIRSMGKVKVEEMNTADLTNAIVDLEARLRNAKVEEERLLELLKRAVNVRDILEIEDRISAVRERIERMEAMKESMKRRVDYATITVNLLKEGVQTSEEGSFLERILRDATRALLGSIYIIVVGGAFLVVPLAIALLIWLIYKISYSKRREER